ncbi:DUF4184 family protein [Actinacidiphila yeochonensis]|uniref:DUF4184 family protein n=1 Tax=Actinacidiphila yeochonensis TaxID=89050 RepID=UPI00055D7FAC|nr:DUF4184 family protein [Actinacidiphila yeochonensis]
MPFTLSHPAAVLPFLRAGRARGPWIGSALAAGSIAPDVPFFADSLVRGTYGFGRVTHSVWGVPTVDVAIAAALAAAWHGLLREPLTALLPGRWADAADALTAPAGRPFDARAAGWFAVSAAVGAATHVGWDAFTHGGRLGERLLPVLGATVHGMPLYSLLQYGCSAAALGLLGWYVPHALRRADPAGSKGRTVGATSGERAATNRIGKSHDGMSGGVEPEDGAGEGVGREPWGAAGGRTPRRRTRLSGRGRAAVAALVAAAAVAGAAQRVAGWTTGPLSRARPLDLVPLVAFGGGAGTAVGLGCYAVAVRLRDACRPSEQAG